MRKLLTPFFILLFVTGCASADLMREAETPEQKYWSALQVFDVYDEAALNLARDPNTPVAVKQRLKNVRSIANQARLVANEAYEVLQAARVRLAEIPNETELDRVNAALKAFSDRAQILFNRVDAFRDEVDRIQGQ